MTPQMNASTAEVITLGETDSLAPYEFYATFKRSSYTDPERRLMAAVLEDAVTCLTFNQPRYSRRQLKDFAEAKTWINETTDSDWAFSFVNVCESLGFDPGYLREGLNHWAARRHQEILQASRAPRRRSPGLRHKKIRLRAVY